MNKIVSLVAITTLCTITTAMHGALPPGKEWRDEAREAWRVGKAKELGPEATEIIQKFLVPRSIPVIVTNADNQADRKLRITFMALNSHEGTTLNSFSLYPNNLCLSASALGKYNAHSLTHRAKEKEQSFKQTVYVSFTQIILFEGILVKIENTIKKIAPAKTIKRRFLLLNVSDLINIQEICIEFDGVTVKYFNGTIEKKPYDCFDCTTKNNVFEPYGAVQC